MSLISELKKSGLTGRGGAGFPTWLKWGSVKKASGNEKYVVCNASEGEPGVLKDRHILKEHTAELISGIMLAIDFFCAKNTSVRGIIYINPKYYKIFKKKLEKLVTGKPIEIFKKPYSAGYIGGEETSALNAIEGKRIEPRLRPPYPTAKGLWSKPTLVNNVETFYHAHLIAAGKYKKQRFFTISGDCLWDGVYEFLESYTIEKILKKTNNYPNFDFFVQVGGDSSGEVLNSRQLKCRASGAGSIRVYSSLKYKPLDLIKKWLDFFVGQSCGQCTPCREGSLRLKELINEPEINWPLFMDLLDNLEDSSFCALGYSLPVPIASYLNNVVSNKDKKFLKYKM